MLQIATPGSSGFTSYLTNYGEIRNSGFELSIQSVNIRTKDFTWKTELNVSRNKNVIEEIPPISHSQAATLIRLQKGKPMYSYWLYKQLYVDPETGDAVFEDLTKDGSITAADPADRWQYLARLLRRFQATISNIKVSTLVFSSPIHLATVSGTITVCWVKPAVRSMPTGYCWQASSTVGPHPVKKPEHQG